MITPNSFFKKMTKGIKILPIVLTISLGAFFTIALRGEVSSGSGIASAAVIIGGVLVIGACRKIWNYKSNTIE